MKAVISHVPVALQQAMAINLSRYVKGAAALTLIVLAITPINCLAARSWEVGTDVKLNLFRKHIELTTDPEAFIVELPAGQTEITKVFPLELPDDPPLIQLSEIIDATFKDNPAVLEWAQNPWQTPMLFKTEVQVSAEGNQRLFEVSIALGRPNTGDIGGMFGSHWKMYMLVAPEFYPDIPEELPENVQPSPETFRDVSISVGTGFWNIYKDRSYQPEKYRFLLDERNTRQNSVSESMALLVTLREVPLACWMKVEYWGDFEGGDFGDLAYYNNFLDPDNRYAAQGGVGRATGSAVDPTAQATLDYLMEMTGAYEEGNGSVLSEEEAAATAGSVFDPFSDETFPELEELAKRQEMEKFYNWLGEKVEGEELETFGVTMAGRNATDKVGEKMESFLKQMVAASVLEAASSSPTVKMTTYPATGKVSKAHIPLSRLAFKPMSMGSPFHWSEGEPGFGTLQVTPLTAGVIAGEINGTLYSHEVRQEDGSDSEVSIHARFIAAEGAFGCDAPGVDKILK